MELNEIFIKETTGDEKKMELYQCYLILFIEVCLVQMKECLW